MVPVNGQPAAPPPPAAAPVAPQHPDPSQSFMENMDFGNLEFANPLNSSDVLNDFDFDSFLHDSNADDGSGFDFAATAFMEGEGIGAE